MYLVHNYEASEHKHAPNCYVLEYQINDRDINGAVASIQGRYPDSGHVQNLRCKQMAYIISGSGRILVDNKEYPLSAGDVVLLLPGEKYAWEGNMKIFMPCTPAWTPDQYRHVE